MMNEHVSCIYVDSIAFSFSLAAGNTRCTTNMSASGDVQQNDVMMVTCSITYGGNWAPVMRWFSSVTRRNFADDDITSTTSNTTVTSQLTVTASADLHGSQIICLTYFTQPSISLQTHATNIPSYTYMWTSPTLNVFVKCKYFSLCSIVAPVVVVVHISVKR